MNSDIAMAAFTGLLRGKSEREEKTRMLEEKKQAMALQKEMLKIQLENAKAAQMQKAQEQAWIQRLFPQPQGTGLANAPAATGPTFSPSFDQGPGAAGGSAPQPQQAPSVATSVLDELSALSPLQQQLIKKTTGIDVPAAVEAARKQQQDDFMNQMRLNEHALNLEKYNRDFSRGSWQRKINPDGSESFVKMPEFGGMGQQPTMAPQAPAAGGQPAPQQLPTEGQPSMGMGDASPVPLENFSYVGDDGKEYSVIREKRTGKPVTTPVATKLPEKGTSEWAGRLAMARSSKAAVPELRKLLFKNGGGLNERVLFEMAAPGGGIGSGRAVKSKFKEAVDARIRAASGAAVPPSELANYEVMYLPSPMDITSPGLAEDKLMRFELWINDFIDILDPGGRVQKNLGGKATAPAAATPEQRAQDLINKYSKAK